MKKNNILLIFLILILSLLNIYIIYSNSSDLIPSICFRLEKTFMTILVFILTNYLMKCILRLISMNNLLFRYQECLNHILFLIVSLIVVSNEMISYFVVTETVLFILFVSLLLPEIFKIVKEGNYNIQNITILFLDMSTLFVLSINQIPSVLFVYLMILIFTYFYTGGKNLFVIALMVFLFGILILFQHENILMKVQIYFRVLDHTGISYVDYVLKNSLLIGPIENNSLLTQYFVKSYNVGTLLLLQHGKLIFTGYVLLIVYQLHLTKKVISISNLSLKICLLYLAIESVFSVLYSFGVPFTSYFSGLGLLSLTDSYTIIWVIYLLVNNGKKISGKSAHDVFENFDAKNVMIE